MKHNKKLIKEVGLKPTSFNILTLKINLILTSTLTSI